MAGHDGKGGYEPNFSQQEGIARSSHKHAVLQTIGIIDSHGRVDVEGLANDLREQIRERGKLTIALPLFGNFTFVESDVDELYRTIMEG